MKILLVEDNVLNQKVVTFHLRKRHYDVVATASGYEAIKIVKREPVDLILMDIMLPEMNGFEITKEIREYENQINKKNKVPIIALTANTLDNDKEKCLQAGMDDYLPKPFTAQDLYRVMEAFTRME